MPGTQKSVLIVDDSQTVTSLLQVYLLSGGFSFEVASDGAQALAKARARKPDLVISDLKMPGMDGFALCAAIKGDPVLHDVPVIMLTSDQDENARKRCRLLGAEAFLNKPVTPQALREVVGRVLGLPGKAA